MSDDVGLRHFVVNPAGPHRLMDEEGILGNAHSIGDTAGAVVRLATMVGVGVREDNLHATAADTRARAGALQPVVIPAAHHLNGKLVHVMVILTGRLTTIERALPFLMERIAVGIPVFAQALVAAILHGPHGVLVRLVDVQHLTAIFCLVYIQHLTTTDGTSSMRVVLVANLLQLQHVFARDAFVAALIEQDTGIVAVVDDGVAHQLGTLVPARTGHILLGITGRHGLGQSHAVARLYVLLPGGDVHPAHHVTTRLHHQLVAVVAQPGRHGDTHAGPFVAGSLGIAVHHEYTVVEPYLALAKARLAEARPCNDLVDGRTIDHKSRFNSIEIAVAPRPEVQAADGLLGCCHDRSTRCCRHVGSLKRCHLSAVHVLHAYLQGEGTCRSLLVLYLRLCMDRCPMVGDVVVCSIDVGTRCAQVRIQGQGLIQLPRHVQIHVLRNATIVGVKVTVVPLVAAVVLARTVVPAVVATHGQHILALLDKWRQVEATGHHAVLAHAEALTVQVEVCPLTDTLELDEYLRRLRSDVSRKRKALTIPADGIGQVNNVFLECFLPVKGIGKRHRQPVAIVEVSLGSLLKVANFQAPFSIEVQLCSFNGMSRGTQQQHASHKKQDSFHHSLFINL